jgi:predicted O-methyltransferase YrrM/Fe-S-cluster containining protein
MTYAPAQIKQICSQECGARCCRGGPGGLNVVLTKREVERLSALALEKGLDFKFQEGVAGRSMRLEAEKPCAFLDLGTNLCSIHKQRPSACKTYPHVNNLDGCILSGWKEAKKPKIFIGVPRGGQPRLHEFETNLRSILWRVKTHGFAAQPVYYECRSPRVDNNRNAICEQFLLSDGEYLVMLDDDMVFPVQAPEVLAWKLGKLRKAEPKAGILCGLYFQKRLHSLPHIYKNPKTTWRKERNEWVTEHDWMDGEAVGFLKDYPEANTDEPVVLWGEGGSPLLKSLTPISAGGTGFICIHREVLEGTPRPWFREMGREPGESGAHGGDLAFFKRARLAGFAAWADVGLIASHYNSQPVGAATFLRDRKKWEGEQLDVFWAGPGLSGSKAMNGSELSLGHQWSIGEEAFRLIVGLIDKFESLKILVFGSGRSTIRLALEFPGAEIHAIEHNEKHWEMVKEMGVDQEVQADLRLHLAPLGDDISGIDLPDEFDFIFIDLRQGDGGRFKAMEDAARLVKMGGLIVMDDAVFDESQMARIVRREPEQEATRIAMFDCPDAFECRNVDVGHGIAILRKVEREGTETIAPPQSRSEVVNASW